MTRTPILRIGTRASALARWQADWVSHRLEQIGAKVELVPIKTAGDVQSGPLGQIGGQGLFTKRIQEALLEDRIDVAVHSLKDLPTEPVEGLGLAAVPRRAEVFDALVSRVASCLEKLPDKARVGTGSMRRRAQLLHLRNDLKVLEIRGNVDTRLKKLDEGQYDAIILATAGLRRLGLDDRIVQIIPAEQMMPAIGQGALGLETRTDDQSTNEAAGRLDDALSHASVLAERTMLATLRGGCLAPVGAWARTQPERLDLDGVVLSATGEQRLSARASGHPSEARRLGQTVAQSLIDQGAAALLAESRETTR